MLAWSLKVIGLREKFAGEREVRLRAVVDYGSSGKRVWRALFCLHKVGFFAHKNVCAKKKR